MPNPITQPKQFKRMMRDTQAKLDEYMYLTSTGVEVREILKHIEDNIKGKRTEERINEEVHEFFEMMRIKHDYLEKNILMMREHLKKQDWYYSNEETIL